MKNIATIAQMLVRITGLLQIILGVLFWLNIATSLTLVHIILGIVLVVSLWVLAILGAQAGASPLAVAVAFAWGAATIALGLYQAQLLVGSTHWVIQWLHLLVGLGAIGQAEALGSRIKKSQAPILQAS